MSVGVLQRRASEFVHLEHRIENAFRSARSRTRELRALRAIGVGALQCRDVQFIHPEHRIEYAFRSVRIRIGE
jgi:hypothetical protein